MRSKCSASPWTASGHVDVVGQSSTPPTSVGPSRSRRRAPGAATRRRTCSSRSMRLLTAATNGRRASVDRTRPPRAASPSTRRRTCMSPASSRGRSTSAVRRSTRRTRTIATRSSRSSTWPARHVWSKHFTSNSNDQGVGIDVDGSGQCRHRRLLHQRAEPRRCRHDGAQRRLPTSTSRSSTPNGNHLWSKKLGSDLGNEDARGIAFDPSGNVVIVGVAISAVNFGGGSLSAGGQGYGVRREVRRGNRRVPCGRTASAVRGFRHRERGRRRRARATSSSPGSTVRRIELRRRPAAIARWEDRTATSPSTRRRRARAGLGGHAYGASSIDVLQTSTPRPVELRSRAATSTAPQRWKGRR